MFIKKGVIVAMLSLMSTMGSLGIAEAKSSETIKMIVGYPAGSPADAVSRIVQARLNKDFDKNIVIEYKAGAAGSIACDALARSNTNETILMVNGPGMLVNPIINPADNCNYNKVYPVALMGDFPFLLVTSTKFGVTDLKKWPDTPISYSTSGVGSGAHLTGEYFKSITGKNMVHVPYKGVVQSLPDLLAGTVDVSFTFPFLVVPHVKDGKLLPVAVTGKSRLKELPNVPTFDELGYKNVEGTWIHLFANNSDSEDIRKIRDILKQAMGEKEFVQELNAVGMQHGGASNVIPPKNYLDNEYKKFNKILSKVKIEN